MWTAIRMSVSPEMRRRLGYLLGAASIGAVLMLLFSPRGMSSGSVVASLLVGLALLATKPATWMWRRFVPESTRNHVRFGDQFFGGVAYLVLVALGVSALTGHGIFVSFAAVVATAIVWIGLVLVLMMRWANNSHSRPGQFSLGSLLIAMLMVSLFLATVHWLTEHAMAQMTPTERSNNGPGIYAAAAISCIFVGLTGVPLLAMTTTSVVWMAAWLVRLPRIQRMLRRRKKIT